MASPFYVAPAIATQPAMQGLGALAQAGGQALGRIGQEDQRAQQTQAFMTLVNQAETSTDPAEKQRLMTRAFVEFPDQAKQLVNQTKLMREQKALTSPVEENPEYVQGTGAMSGYTFDKTTGKYSIDQDVKQALEDKAAAKAQEGAKLSAKDRQGINKDVTALIGDTVGISNAAKSLSKLKASSSPSAQLAAIFKFMKSLDPTSVVREGEQQMARNTGGPADYLVGIVSQIQGEGSLPPTVFTDMVKTSQDLADSAIEASTGEVNSYLDTYEDTLPASFKNSLINRLPKAKRKSMAKNKAPQAAVDYLRQNPQAAEQFKAKYGYLPEG